MLEEACGSNPDDARCRWKMVLKETSDVDTSLLCEWIEVVSSSERERRDMRYVEVGRA